MSIPSFYFQASRPAPYEGVVAPWSQSIILKFLTTIPTTCRCCTSRWNGGKDQFAVKRNRVLQLLLITHKYAAMSQLGLNVRFYTHPESTPLMPTDPIDPIRQSKPDQKFRDRRMRPNTLILIILSSRAFLHRLQTSFKIKTRSKVSRSTDATRHTDYDHFIPTRISPSPSNLLQNQNPIKSFAIDGCDPTH